jgi:hypothetical protein
MSSTSESLAKKLEAFAKTLPPEELSMFAGALHKPAELSDQELEKASGGAISIRSGQLALQSLQGRQLDAGLFRRLLDW